ncbi:MAG: sporulation protein, partial [Clostridia bacterium]|nr:sporulation protein [Clostridia bacterium]
HTSPTYGSPFDMMKQFGITYKTAGENIAMGQRTPEEVVKAWMNSPGHRANILKSSFTHIGVGYVANGSYWTQMFIGK